MSTLSWFKGIINTIGRVLFFSLPPDEPLQGQSNHHLLILMKSIEEQIQERIAARVTGDTLLDWNMALMLNAARHTDSIPTTGEIWIDEDGNPVPYNDGIVAEYPRM